MSHNTHTATADYTPVNQVMTFESNTRDCVDVMTVDDDTLEFSETFQISLIPTTSDDDVNFGDISVATITILNNDCNSDTLHCQCCKLFFSCYI